MSYYSAEDIKVGLERFNNGYERAFNFMHEYCNQRHMVFDDECFFSCSLNEKQKGYDKQDCECCFKKCPLLMRGE